MSGTGGVFEGRRPGGGDRRTALLCVRPDRFGRCPFGSLDVTGGPGGPSLAEGSQVRKRPVFCRAESDIRRSGHPAIRPSGNPDIGSHPCSSRHPHPQPQPQPQSQPQAQASSPSPWETHRRGP